MCLLVVLLGLEGVLHFVFVCSGRRFVQNTYIRLSLLETLKLILFTCFRLLATELSKKIIKAMKLFLEKQTPLQKYPRAFSSKT